MRALVGLSSLLVARRGRHERGTSAPACALTSSVLIPYLSGGAGVYLDDDGRPVTSEGATAHARHPPASRRSAAGVAARQPTTSSAGACATADRFPCADPAAPTPPRLRDTSAQISSRPCGPPTSRPSSAAPTSPGRTIPTSPARPATDVPAARRSRCGLARESIAHERIGTEAFARGLFVLAHEAAHATGIADECEADKRGLATMGSISARKGGAFAVGDEAGRSPAPAISSARTPPPDPYCIQPPLAQTRPVQLRPERMPVHARRARARRAARGAPSRSASGSAAIMLHEDACARTCARSSSTGFG